MPLSLPLRGCAAASPAGGDFREEQTTYEAIFYENGNMAAGRGDHHRGGAVRGVGPELRNGAAAQRPGRDRLALPGGGFRRGGLGGISQRFEDVETLQQENDELRQQIAELEEQLRQMEPAATENKELRQLLGLRQQRSDLVFEAARVTQRDVSNWASTLVLDRGSQHGVAIGDCAVDSAGNLVGVVTDVGLNWCRLSTVLDTDSQFGARVFRTGETAVAGGDLALMSEGRLRLQYLSDSANLIKGDVIVTSGLGGYYPAGLVIGTVESVQTDDGGLARYAVLSPKCDVAAIQEMFIITDFDVIQ
jgi:rod shape-determining protein MreC